MSTVTAILDWLCHVASQIARFCRIAWAGPDYTPALAAYMDAYEAGDSDAYCGLSPDWHRHPAASSGSYAADRSRGYLDGFAQETARQQGAQS